MSLLRRILGIEEPDVSQRRARALEHELDVRIDEAEQVQGLVERRLSLLERRAAMLRRRRS